MPRTTQAPAAAATARRLRIGGADIGFLLGGRRGAQSPAASQPCSNHPLTAGRPLRVGVDARARRPYARTTSFDDFVSFSPEVPFGTSCSTFHSLPSSETPWSETLKRPLSASDFSILAAS